MLLAFHKPYGVLSQFTPESGSRWGTLAEFGFPPRVYPIGRLDADSEGLLLLSDEGSLNAALLHPEQGHWREYHALVEREPDDGAMQRMRAGVVLAGRRTLPCEAVVLDPQPTHPARVPPVRVRKTVTDWWISLRLREGKYHQVRKMTACVGHPTVRLIRTAVGGLCLSATGLASGQWKELTREERVLVLQTGKSIS
jgi:23S rRNA pseudouridine2457 synthase